MERNKNTTRLRGQSADGFPLAERVVIGEHVGHEDFRGITWAVFSPPDVNPLAEDSFSRFAICRARAALAAAAALCPGDVVAASF